MNSITLLHMLEAEAQVVAQDFGGSIQTTVKGRKLYERILEIALRHADREMRMRDAEEG